MGMTGRGARPVRRRGVGPIINVEAKANLDQKIHGIAISGNERRRGRHLHPSINLLMCRRKPCPAPGRADVGRSGGRADDHGGDGQGGLSGRGLTARESPLPCSDSTDAGRELRWFGARGPVLFRGANHDESPREHPTADGCEPQWFSEGATPGSTEPQWFARSIPSPVIHHEGGPGPWT